MPIISVTRLRLASRRHLPAFAWHALRSSMQARRAAGFLGMHVLPDQHLTFWTATAWVDLIAMKQFRSAGAHRRAMPRLAAWCDEAAVIRWIGDLAAMGDWHASHARMVSAGEPSAVRHPSAAQATLAYAPPKVRPRVELRLFAPRARPPETPANPR